MMTRFFFKVVDIIPLIANTLALGIRAIKI